MFGNILVTSALNSTTIIALEYLRIGERANFVNAQQSVGYVFHLFHSHGLGDFVSGSDVNS